jgi:hypothetical protein
MVKNGDHSNIFKETKSLNNSHSPNIDHQRLVNIGIAPLLRCLHGSPSIHMAGNAACWRAGFSYASCCGKPGDEGAKDVVSKQDKIWIWSWGWLNMIKHDWTGIVVWPLEIAMLVNCLEQRNMTWDFKRAALKYVFCNWYFAFARFRKNSRIKEDLVASRNQDATIRQRWII